MICFNPIERQKLCHRKAKTAVSLTGCYDGYYDPLRPGLPAPGTPLGSLCRHFFPIQGIIVSAGICPYFGACRKGKGIEAGKPAIAIAPGAIFL